MNIPLLEITLTSSTILAAAFTVGGVLMALIAYFLKRIIDSQDTKNSKLFDAVQQLNNHYATLDTSNALLTASITSLTKTMETQQAMCRILHK